MKRRSILNIFLPLLLSGVLSLSAPLIAMAEDIQEEPIESQVDENASNNEDNNEDDDQNDSIVAIVISNMPSEGNSEEGQESKGDVSGGNATKEDNTDNSATKIIAQVEGNPVENSQSDNGEIETVPEGNDSNNLQGNPLADSDIPADSKMQEVEFTDNTTAASDQAETDPVEKALTDSKSTDNATAVSNQAETDTLDKIVEEGESAGDVFTDVSQADADAAIVNSSSDVNESQAEKTFENNEPQNSILDDMSGEDLVKTSADSTITDSLNQKSFSGTGLDETETSILSNSDMSGTVSDAAIISGVTDVATFDVGSGDKIIKIENADFIDAEKYSRDAIYDSKLCWAATSSNMLWIANYAQNAINPLTNDYFMNTDEVFDYFTFTDEASATDLGINYFISGNNIVENSDGAPKLKENAPKGGLIEGVSVGEVFGEEYSDYINIFEPLVNEDKKAVGMGLQLYDTELDKIVGGHAVTIIK